MTTNTWLPVRGESGLNFLQELYLAKPTMLFHIILLPPATRPHASLNTHIIFLTHVWCWKKSETLDNMYSKLFTWNFLLMTNTFTIAWTIKLVLSCVNYELSCVSTCFFFSHHIYHRLDCEQLNCFSPVLCWLSCVCSSLLFNQNLYHRLSNSIVSLLSELSCVSTCFFFFLRTNTFNTDWAMKYSF